MSFSDAFQRVANTTKTTNGQVAYSHPLNANLAYFAHGTFQSNLELFKNSFRENRYIALANLLYNRDKVGKGNRANSKEVLRYLGNILDENLLQKVISAFVELGRWDDLMVLLDTNSRQIVLEVLRNRLAQDYERALSGKSISLLAKWMPSINSGNKSRKLALDLCKAFDVDIKTYRKTLSFLRGKLELVETWLSQGDSNINFDSIPSKALKYHRKALLKHPKFERWFNSKETVKASSLFAYEIIKLVQNREYDTAQKFWDSLVAHYKNMKDLPSFLVMGDISGSMQSDVARGLEAIDVSLSLALFSAYVNPLQGTMTFTDKASFMSVMGKDLRTAYTEITKHYGLNTNLENAFNSLLKVCIDNKVDYNDMPKFIVICSDMQFDAFGTGRECGVFNQDTQTRLQRMFERNGYELPRIVYWQVSHTLNYPVVKDTQEAILIGGFNQNILFDVLRGNATTPESFMLEKLAKYEKYLA